jgi:hypothetical protein
MRRLGLPISKVERWLMKKMIRRGFMLGRSAATLQRRVYYPNRRQNSLWSCARSPFEITFASSNFYERSVQPPHRLRSILGDAHGSGNNLWVVPSLQAR